eukprot:CAMPEP_0113880486 /NCGR_PEP_ID=MMETSP0780_2-20120614/7814_1 /TAXON_ID=652834 /ORGANISM="Palpitomonas bilix" /LENGTH=598 /DNA_ID=CAMNT_0000867171 /DNA_START=32 /DNA_END=1828 /DNA_ORIENTATION=+ /assembly_acc=CAM_ASM_000599
MAQTEEEKPSNAVEVGQDQKKGKKKKKNNKKKGGANRLPHIDLSGQKLDDGSIAAALIAALEGEGGADAQELRLATNRIGDSGLLEVLSILDEKKPTFLRLKLASNQITLSNDLLCSRLSAWMNSRVGRQLDLASNRVEAAGLSNLAKALEGEEGVEEGRNASINLSGLNQLGGSPGGRLAISAILRSAKRRQGSFRSIELRGCNLDDADVKGIATGLLLAGQGVVDELDLTNNCISQEGINLLRPAVARSGCTVKTDVETVEGDKNVAVISEFERKRHAAKTASSDDKGFMFFQDSRSGDFSSTVTSFVAALEDYNEEAIASIPAIVESVIELIKQWLSHVNDAEDGPKCLHAEESPLSPIVKCIPLMAEQLSIERMSRVGTCGSQLERLGRDRMAFISLVAALLDGGIVAAFEYAVEESQFVQLALDSMFRFPNANIAHVQIEKIVKALLLPSPESVDPSRWFGWQKSVLESTGFLGRVATAFNEQAEMEEMRASGKAGKPRLCNIAFLGRIATAVSEAAQQPAQQKLREFVSQHEGFEGLVSGKLQQHLDVQGKEWECGKPAPAQPVPETGGFQGLGSMQANDISRLLAQFWRRK